MEELVKFCKEFIQLGNSELPNREAFERLFSTEGRTEVEIKIIETLLPYVRQLCWLHKNPIDGEMITGFSHTVMVMKEIRNLPKSDDIDLVIAFFHDIGEYQVLKKRIDELTDKIINKFNLLDHSDVELVHNSLMEMYIDKIQTESFRFLPEEIQKYIKENQIKNKGHEEVSAKIFSDLYSKLPGFDVKTEWTIEYCIRQHMHVYYVHMTSYKDDIQKLDIGSKNFHRLITKVWYSIINAIPFNGKAKYRIEVKDLYKRVYGNPCIKGI